MLLRFGKLDKFCEVVWVGEAGEVGVVGDF